MAEREKKETKKEKKETRSLHVILDSGTHKRLRAVMAQESLQSISEAVRYVLRLGLAAEDAKGIDDFITAGYKEGVRRAYAKAAAALGMIGKELELEIKASHKPEKADSEVKKA